MSRLLKNLNNQTNFQDNNEKKNILVYVPVRCNFGYEGILFFKST